MNAYYVRVRFNNSFGAPIPSVVTRIVCQSLPVCPEVVLIERARDARWWRPDCVFVPWKGGQPDGYQGPTFIRAARPLVPLEEAGPPDRPAGHEIELTPMFEWFERL